MGIEVIAAVLGAAISGIVSGYFAKRIIDRDLEARKELLEEQRRLDVLVKTQGNREPAPRFVEYDTPTGVREFKLDVTNTDSVRDFVRVMQESSNERVAGAR